MKEQSFWLKLVVFLLMAVIIMLGVIIFKIYSDKPNTTSEDKQVVEIQTDTIQAPAPESEPEPVVEAPFVTNDLKWAQLQGHVKSVRMIAPVEHQVTPEKYNFDAEGNFLPENGSVVRDAEGRIIKYTYTFIIGAPDDPCKEKCYLKYKYNKDGYVAYSHYSLAWLCCDGGTEALYFNTGENGWPVSGRRENSGSLATEVDFYKESYTYPKIDDHGNWTELRVRTTFYKSKCGDSEWSENETDTYTIRRNITYWEDSK